MVFPLWIVFQLLYQSSVFFKRHLKRLPFGSAAHTCVFTPCFQNLV